MNRDIKIGVIGGTGKAGKYLIGELVKQGFSIKALVRNPDKLEESDLIEKVMGDVLNYEAVLNLVSGCNAIVSTLGQSKGQDPVFSSAGKNIVNAMETLQIKRYIVLTGLTLDTQSDNKGFRTRMRSLVMRLFFRKIIRDKQDEYNTLQASRMDWTIVRVPFIELTDSQKGIETSLYDCKGSSISSIDLSRFLIDQISDETYLRKAPFIWNS